MAKRIVKKTMPCVVLNKIAVLPGMVIHFDLTKIASVKAVEKTMIKDHKFFAAVADGIDSEKDSTSVSEYGTICVVKQIVKMPGDVVRILVEGLNRAVVTDLFADDGINYVTVKQVMPEDDFVINPEVAPVDETAFEDVHDAYINVRAKLDILRDIIRPFSVVNTKSGKDLMDKIESEELLSTLIDYIGSNVPMDYSDKIRLVQSTSVQDRLNILIKILQNNAEVFKTKAEIARKVKENVESSQKKFYLREQLKVIKEQLGKDDEDEDDEKSQYREKVRKLKAPKDVKDRINKEIDRLGRMSVSSSEAEVSRSYIEALLDMPWDKKSKDNNDIDRAQAILEEDHYGLDKVKERVLEFLAVRNLTSKGDSPIMCLVGPPGTGKTSIAKSVARALNKEYVRICLGGVRDEAEIRGHRRTYVGAMTGRIAAGIKQAGVKNPLMLLDEIDKMSSDHKGDTASAMLEVLDPAQNSHFVDHYIELPIDLSDVLFIATANNVADIPRPLLDRMELIEVSSYTENEKIHIAKEHLVNKVLENNGLTDKQVIFADTIWPLIIGGYTKEAGVRELERKIGQIARKSARKIYQDGKKNVRVNKGNLEEYLGKRKYEADIINEADEIGIVRGLAWTSVGGDTLSIEVNVMPGKGEVMLTGKLGDVMKESASAGMSYIRSIAPKHGIKDAYFKNHDFHIHIPEGAVPKDGPSAGITMATALYSAITGIKVKKDVAMTGEITLRGRVLPIGGLKEKLLAAKNAGVKKVLVPAKNKKDVDEIDNEIKGGLKIVFVNSMDEVLGEALNK